jgi:hypothetical protein
VAIKAIAVARFEPIYDGVVFGLQFPARTMNGEVVSLTRLSTANATPLSGVSIAPSYRRIATRYEKKAENYLAMLSLASIMMWL